MRYNALWSYGIDRLIILLPLYEQNEETPLHIAIRIGHVQLVCLLIEEGADKEKADKVKSCHFIYTLNSFVAIIYIFRWWIYIFIYCLNSMSKPLFLWQVSLATFN